MKFIHTSDWHLGKTLDDKPRIEEQKKFLTDFVDIVKAENADMVIIAGDIYDTFNPPAEAEKLFYDTLKKISQGGKVLTVVIAGNHDSPERLAAANPLAMEHGIITLAYPKSVVLTGDYGRHTVTESGEGYFKVDINGEKAVIAAVPYPSEKRLNEVLSSIGADEAEESRNYAERVGELFSRLNEKFEKDTVNIAVSHLFVAYSALGGSENSPALGGSYAIPAEYLPKDAQYIALGHIHKPQRVPHTDGRAYYSGAPLCYHRDETAEDKRHVLSVDIKAGEKPLIKEIPIKNYKPIEKWYAKSIAEAIKLCEDNKDRDCYAYISVETEDFITEEDMRTMRSLKKDIMEIHPIYIGEDEEEETEDVLNLSISDAFTEFFKREKGVEPPDELVDLLTNIMAEEEE